jgi:lactate permease
MPALHNLVQRMPPVAPINAKPEAARFTINWLSAAGTGVFVAALLSGLVLKLNPAQWLDAFGRTLVRMKTPVIVIALVLGLGFLTRYSGTDAVLGLAFTSAGFFYACS